MSEAGGTGEEAGVAVEQESGARPGLRQLGLRGAFWMAIGQGGSQGFRLAGNLVLTRPGFLDPLSFGLMLIVKALMGAFEAFSDIGIAASIVQHPDGEAPRFRDTAWTFQVLRGLLLYAVLYLAARPIAAFYDAPALEDLLPIAGLGLVLAGLASPALQLRKRRLDMRSLAWIDLCAEGVAFVVMVVHALVSPTVWSLVYGFVAGIATRTLLSHLCFPDCRPRLGLERTAALAILGFGAWIVLNTPLGFLADQLDRLALGKLFEGQKELLGVYQIAIVFGGIPYLVLVKLGAGIAFPAFSKAKNEGRDLGRVFDGVRLPIYTIGGLALAGIIATGGQVVTVLYDARWHDAGWMVALVALGQWFRVASIPAANYLFALGEPKWLVVANAAKILGYLAFVPLGYVSWGLVGALGGFALGEAAGFASYAVALRLRGIRDLWPELGLLLLLLATGGLGRLLADLLAGAGWHPVAGFALCAPAVLLAWAPVLRRALLHLRGRAPA
ncbi:MAG: oligosaccharide flippase family protein [Planctomycetota bacterium]